MATAISPTQDRHSRVRPFSGSTSMMLWYRALPHFPYTMDSFDLECISRGISDGHLDLPPVSYSILMILSGAQLKR
eukprot:361064-Chlamydomonas_euryale.AAC.11